MAWRVSRLAVAIAEYRERGYRVAIDNFGRHSADLDRLEALAPDIVKLDRCLIGHFGHLSLAKRVMTELAAEAVASACSSASSASKTPAAAGGPGGGGGLAAGASAGPPGRGLPADRQAAPAAAAA
jgi:hypothetical protein